MGEILIDGDGFQLNEENERAVDKEGAEIQISHDEKNNILDEEGKPKMDEESGEAMTVKLYTPEPSV